MRAEVSKNIWAGALAVLGTLVSRMSPLEKYKPALIAFVDKF